MSVKNSYSTCVSHITADCHNKSAPYITETSLKGFNSVSLGEIKSPNIKLVNFWASWCPPCRAEHPKLLELAKQGVQIIGVNFNDKETSYRW